MSPTKGRQQQPVIWENQTVGSYHVVNNENGDHIACDAFGKPIPPFHPGVTGVASTKERLSLELKDTVWEKTLQKKAPPRPPVLEPHLLQERLLSLLRRP